MALKLWGRPTSARTQKAILALAELGMDYELILASGTMGTGGHVSKGHAPYGVVDTDAYRAMNPNGTVPTIDDDGFVLWESNAIVAYLGMAYDPALFYGNDTRTFASASRWMAWENNQLIPPMHALVMQLVRLPEAERDAAITDAANQKLIGELKIVEAQLGRTDYIAGDRWTMGDIPLAINLHRWHLFDMPGPEMPNLARYYAQVKARPAFEAIADPAMHLSG